MRDLYWRDKWDHQYPLNVKEVVCSLVKYSNNYKLMLLELCGFLMDFMMKFQSLVNSIYFSLVTM